MIDQEVLNYIQKARGIGQQDQQTRTLLSKNGWTEAEITEAFAVLDMEKPRPETQPQPQAKPFVQPLEPEPQQIQSQYRPQPAQTSLVQKRTGPRILPVLLFLVFFFIILGGLAGAGFIFKDQILSFVGNFLGKTDPETVIAKAWQNSQNLESQDFSAKLAVNSRNLRDRGGENITFNINATAGGGISNSNQNDLLSRVTGSLSAVTTTGSGSAENISAAGELRLIGQNFYLRLDNLDLTALDRFLSSSGADKIIGKWVELDQDINPTFYSLLTGATDKAVIERILQVFKEKKLYEIRQLSNVQGTQGEEYNYSILLDREKISEALPQLFSAINNQDLPFETFQRDLSRFLGNTGEIKLNLYIGKKDNYIHKAEISHEINISNYDASYAGYLDILLTIEQTGINQPLQVSAPANAASLEEILGGAEPDPISTLLEDIAGAADVVFIANNSYSSLCFKTLLNGYQEQAGNNLITLNNDIIAKGGKKPLCYADAQNFCVSTQLQNGSYLCVSEDGKIGKIKCLGATTICK